MYIGDLVYYRFKKLNNNGICLSDTSFIYFFNSIIKYINYEENRASYSLRKDWEKYD